MAILCFLLQFLHFKTAKRHNGLHDISHQLICASSLRVTACPPMVTMAMTIEVAVDGDAVAIVTTNPTIAFFLHLVASSVSIAGSMSTMVVLRFNLV